MKGKPLDPQQIREYVTEIYAEVDETLKPRRTGDLVTVLDRCLDILNLCDLAEGKAAQTAPARHLQLVRNDAA